MKIFCLQNISVCLAKNSVSGQNFSKGTLAAGVGKGRRGVGPGFEETG
jgi:hypothetical protein